MFEPHSTPYEADDPLGPVILRCRLRPQKDVLTDAGLNPYIMGPFAVIFGGLFPVMPLIFILEGLGLDLPTARLIWWPCYAISCLAVLWVCYGWPRGDYLILQERGLRYRVTFTRLAVSFDEIRQFRVGRHVPGWEKWASAIGEIKFHGLQSLTRNSAENSVTVVLANANTHILKGFLIRFDAEDTARFLEYLVQKYPQVVNPPE